LLLVSASLESSAEQIPNLPSAPSGRSLETNSEEAFRAIFGLEGQLRSNQIAIEQNGKEAREAAARNAELLSKELQTFEEGFLAQQRALSERDARELQTMQRSTRALVIMCGTFAAMASLTMFMVAYFQWRVGKVWGRISMGLPLSTRSDGTSVPKPLESGDAPTQPSNLVAVSNSRLLQAIEHLETRVQELERSWTSPLIPQRAALLPADNGDSHPGQPTPRTTAGSESSPANDHGRIAALLGQGQTMLKKNDWEAALSCFDEVLALEPNNSEALVKKGAALEGLKKLNEAFECYDRAIAANDSMTIAYLHKGGLCSRLERFKEALECYEKALRTHDEWSGSS